jgi:hypothetical protein
MHHDFTKVFSYIADYQNFCSLSYERKEYDNQQPLK